MVFGDLIVSNSTMSPYQYRNKRKPILNNTFVSGSIMHSFTTITYHEEFQTFEDDFYEIFINPPEGCVIYDIKGKFNDKTTEFVVNKLEEPVSSGYYGKNSNSDAINLTLGRIPSDTTVTIEITCTFTANLSSGNSYTFYFPAEQSLLNTDFSADIILTESQNKPIQIKSSEGTITFEKDHLIISKMKLKSSFQLLFEYQNQIESSAFSTKIDRFNYIGLSLHPKSFEGDSTPMQEIYLLIDCSGSMSFSCQPFERTKIENARQALVNFLKELPKSCYFNILRFGSTFEQMFEQSVENNEKNISDSLQYASMLEADLGGTDIYSPLISIINEQPKKGYVRQVFVLTDGEVESPANVISVCNANRHVMRVFPFGIGSDVNRAFCNELAKSTAAEAHFINTNDISSSVLKTLKSSQVSAVVNAQLHIEGVDSFEFAPQPIPSLFENNLTNVVVRYECKNDTCADFLLINGECGKSTYEETVEVEKKENSINLQKLFAYHNIRDMEDRIMNNHEESEKIRQNIVRLSIQSAVVSSFTGMFTVINGVRQKPEDLQKEIEEYQRDQEIQEQQIPTEQDIQMQQQIPTEQQRCQMQQQRCQTQQQICVQDLQLCQQRMTQKQSRNQAAFDRTRAPVQQARGKWGSSQMQQQQMMQKIINQTSQKRVQKQQKIVSQPPPKKVQQDQEVISLLNAQCPNGSWNDVSLIKQLVNMKSKNPAIKDLFAEFPSVGKEMKDLNDDCVITLIVICWLFSEKNEFLSAFENEARKGLDFVRSNSNVLIDNDISKNIHFTNGISWKSNSSGFFSFFKKIFS